MADGWEGKTGGVKFDEGKPRADLLDAYAIEQLTLVLNFGAEKYAAENWRKGISFRRLIAAAMRHLWAIMRGETNDAETELPHAAHLMCCAMFLCWMMRFRRDMDDRFDPYCGECGGAGGGGLIDESPSSPSRCPRCGDDHGA